MATYHPDEPRTDAPRSETQHLVDQIVDWVARQLALQAEQSAEPASTEAA